MIREILRKFIFCINHKTVLINNNRIRISHDLLNYFNVRRNNPVEEQLYSFLNDFLIPGINFLDIGANIGIIGMLASNKVGVEGKVIMFEPNPFIINFLTRIINDNCPCKNYIIIQAAITDKNRRLKMSLNNPESLLMERSSLVLKEKNREEIDVIGVAIDNLVSTDWNIDIIKIDVEGSELQALYGAVKLIEKCRPVICVEIHGLYYENPFDHVNRIFQFFDTIGYLSINLMKGKEDDLKGFMEDSGLYIPLPNGKMSKTSGYGNMIFVPDSQKMSKILNILNNN